MQVFMESLSGVLVILGMILIGYCLTEHGCFKGHADKLIAKLVAQVSLPVLHAQYDHRKVQGS